MAITQIGSSLAATTTNTSSLTITKPTGVASGDVLVAIITCDGTTPTAPSGWVQFGGGLHGSASWNNRLYYKIAGGSEGSNYTWTVGTSGPSAGCINAWRGVDTTDVIDGFIESESTTSSEPNTTPNATITVAGGHKMFYVRCVRDSPGGGTAVAANLTTASGDHGRHSTIGNESSTGNTSYTLGYFTKTLSDAGTGTYNGLAISCDISEDHNYEATYALVAQADPASGDLGATLPAVTSSFAATREIPAGTMAASLAPVVADALGVAAPPEGPLATALAPVSASFTGESVYGSASAALAPISAALSGSVIPSGPLAASLAPITTSFGTETQPFGEHVIVVEAEDRAFSVIDDDPGLLPIARSSVWEPFIPQVEVLADTVFVSAAVAAPTVKLPTYGVAGGVLTGGVAWAPTVSTATVTNASAGSATVSATLSASAKTLSPRPGNILTGGVAWAPTVNTSNATNVAAGSVTVSATAQGPGNINGARAGNVLAGGGVWGPTVPTIAHAGVVTVTAVARGVNTDAAPTGGAHAHAYSPTVTTS